MTGGAYTEGGPLPPVDRQAIADHERRVAEWMAETPAAETLAHAEQRIAALEEALAERIGEPTPGPPRSPGPAEVHDARQHTERDNPP